MKGEPAVPEVPAEAVAARQADPTAHLAVHRGLIVRRALLAGAIRGFLPVPVFDDRLAARIRAGLYQRLAGGRQVDLPPDAALVLAEGDEAMAAANLGVAAAAAVLAKFAGRKALALAAAGRGAEDMTRTFLAATLFDHYCARLHVGGPISVETAVRLRAILNAQVGATPLGPLLGAFREGSHVLGRSLLEAPRWLAQQLASLGERFTRSGGNPDVLDAIPDPPPGGEAAWLHRAAHAVETALAQAGNALVAALVRDFEERWAQQRA